MRECRTCHQSFPATTEYFPKSKFCTIGITFECKPCAKKRHQGYYARDKENISTKGKTPEFRSHRRELYQKNKEHITKLKKLRNATRIPKIPVQKRCSKCKLIKPQSAFWRRSSSAAGLSSACKDCLKPYEKANRHKYKHIHEASWRTHRARRNGAKGKDRITLIALATRDNWRCHICHGKVTKKNWSCDHLIPLSHGGEESWDNVAIAHQLCNNKRNNGRISAQLIMFGSLAVAHDPPPPQL